MSRLLLDTHVVLWLATAPERVPAPMRKRIDAAEVRYLSAAVTWEIAIKVSLGRLTLPETPGRFIETQISELMLTSLPISNAHAAAVVNLPWHHRDPFDRLLLAQAQAEALQIVTLDPAFEKYAAKRKPTK